MINYGYWLTRLLRINYLLISQPLITVEQMNDATVVKSCLCQRSLHGLVIPVGVNADVTGLCEAIIKDAGHDPVLTMRTCHAMKDIIRAVGANPLSIVNDSVGDIGAGNEGKGGYGTAVLHQQVAATISNVILYLFLTSSMRHPCFIIRILFLTKNNKTLALTQGLRPLFLLRPRLAPKQASASRSRRRNSLRSSVLHHSKKKLENRPEHSLELGDRS